MVLVEDSGGGEDRKEGNSWSESWSGRKNDGTKFVDTIDIIHLILSILREKILAKVHTYHQIRKLLLNR